MNHLDAVNGNAELVRDNLGKGRLMPLTMAVAARKDGHATGRIEADFRGFPEADTGPE